MDERNSGADIARQRHAYVTQPVQGTESTSASCLELACILERVMSICQQTQHFFLENFRTASFFFLLPVCACQRRVHI